MACPIVDYTDWEPIYRRIAKEFRYDISEDEKGAKLLDSLLPTSPDNVLERLERMFSGKGIIVTGGALKNSVQLPKGMDGIQDLPLIATGSSVEVLLDAGINIDVVVTDLDKDVQAQVDACAKGATPVLHAHGDNIDLLKEWIPKFGKDILGTCQCEPTGQLVNFGGFTDGDRAVHMALSLGAERCILVGFDMERADDMKARKLRWADLIISMAGNKVEFFDQPVYDPNEDPQ